VASFDDSARGTTAAWHVRRRSPVADRPWLARYARMVSPLRGAAFALAVLLAIAAFVRLGVTPEAVVAGSLICVLIGLSVVDIEQRRLPNRVVLPATVAMLAVQTALSPDRALEWALAAVGAALLLLLPLLVFPGAMGMGDVKLALLLGAGLGATVATALLLAFLSAGVFALAIVARGGADARRRTIAFGPFLAAGAIVTVLMA
jgi:leader peptidase (prepilin peptidase) / N-methyltransferase